MGRLMHDAYGIGLAATQVGVMHRLLVYRTELEGAVAALVNPVLEWSSKDKETSEEGCLSCRASASRSSGPSTCACSAQDERGEPILVEASGLEARVIQHEMDHLDGVLIVDRTSRDQRKQAMRTLREALEPRPRRGACATSTSARRTSRRSCCARLAESEHRPQLVITRPDAKQGRGQKLAPPPVAVLAARARDRGHPARAAARAGGAAADRRRASPRCSRPAPSAS